MSNVSRISPASWDWEQGLENPSESSVVRGLGFMLLKKLIAIVTVITGVCFFITMYVLLQLLLFFSLLFLLLII